MTCLLLWELLPLLQPIAFKISAHLGVVSAVLKSSSSHELSLLLGILFLDIRPLFLVVQGAIV